MRVWALAPIVALTISVHATPAIGEVDEALRDDTVVSWSTRDGRRPWPVAVRVRRWTAIRLLTRILCSLCAMVTGGSIKPSGRGAV